MAKTKNNKRTQSFINLALFIGIIIFINILANARIGGRSFSAFWDLTEDKRFTLTDATRNLLRNLDDVVYIKVLLDGEFPAGFKRLQNATQELLDDYRAQSGFIEYDFEDPSRGSLKEVNERREQYIKEGLRPVSLQVKDNNERSTQVIFPYAQIYYKGRVTNVNLLENQVPGVPQEAVLNNSVSLLEYKLSNAIQKLKSPVKPVVAFTTGHGELSPIETADLEQTLRQFYETGRIRLDSLVSIPANELSALIVAKPRGSFSEQDKFKIDQYVMNGGKVLWLIDKLNVDLDSLRTRPKFYPVEYPLNLDDQLFKYGIRIQPNLILDINSSRIPQVTGMLGNAPQFDFLPYPYHLVVAPASKQPIVKGIGLTNFLYASTIDTAVRTKTPLQKTVLLASSKNSRLQYLPLEMDFEFLKYELDPSKFNKPPQPVAMLLEGQFPSAFENRVSEEMLQGLRQMNLEYKTQSVPTRMLVVSDGDIAKNGIDPQRQSYKPLGFNEFDRYQFANKDFLVNALEYLLDANGVIEARGKEVKLRLLDTVRAQAETTKWQLINLAVPLVFLVAFGLIFNWIRRRRFA
ncbi:MAG: gliding motility-associated ABC transporter substrate-binding protein GldG [Saprospiraceae bacterium]